MQLNSVSICLARLYKGIFPQGQHYKFGFGNGRIINVMASDGGSMYEVSSSPCCVVQLQLTHYCMGKTPCSEGFIGSNEASASTNDTIKKGWGVTVDTFEHFQGRKFYDGYSITLVWQ